jgi:hypothetical protein
VITRSLVVIIVDMIRYLRDHKEFNNWSEEESQRASEMPEDTSEKARSQVEEELEVHQDLQLARSADTFTGDIEEDNDNGVINILDDLTSPVEHDDVFDNRDAHGNNRDLDMAEGYWGDDPFDFGSNGVGSPFMSFGEFMDIDAWNDEMPVIEDLEK